MCAIQVFVAVRLPAVGEYGVEIYACDPLRDADTYTHICQYLVVFTGRDFRTDYGQVFNKLELADGIQADPVLCVNEHVRYASDREGLTRKKPMPQDYAIAKEQHLQIPKDETSITSERLHIIV